MSRTLDEVLSTEDLAVQRVSTVDSVATRLKAMIAAGRLPQGEHLRETPLAEAFSVSRTTIRDAIRVLATDGLVTHEFHKGAVVARLSADDIADVYRVRRLLELSALSYVATGAASTTDRAESALLLLRDSAELSYSVFVEAELEFHGALVAYLQSPRIDQFFGTVLSTLRLALSLLGDDRDPKTTNRLIRRYAELFRSAKLGDVAHAQELLKDHLDEYEDRLMSSLDTTHPFDDHSAIERP